MDNGQDGRTSSRWPAQWAGAFPRVFSPDATPDGVGKVRMQHPPGLHSKPVLRCGREKLRRESMHDLETPLPWEKPESRVQSWAPQQGPPAD